MKDPKVLKNIVKEKYGEIARQSAPSCGCSSSCCGDAAEYKVIGDEYHGLEGYVPDADLGLGCGLPTQHAGIKPGDTVIDLGSGAGNDVFVARSLVGETGRIIGVDMTEDMIDQARRNNAKLGYANVEFRLGDIENMPVEDGISDVVISNCVLNLVPDKAKAFAEISRILKPGGHFCISDLVLQGELPPTIRHLAEAYAGCVAGALQLEDYLGVIKKTGFSGVKVKASKPVILPDDVLNSYLSEEEITLFKKSGTRILSVTVVGFKG